MRFIRFLRRSPPPGDAVQRTSRGRVGRWALRALGAAAAIAFLGVLAAFVGLHSLDRPWLKSLLQRRLHAALGVDVDYAAARVALSSGIEIDGLVVRSPEPMRPFAPDLVRVGRATASWSLGSLLGHGGPRVARVTVSDADLNVVIDADGRTSFDVFASHEVPPPKRTPLSLLPSSIFGGPHPVGTIDVGPVVLTLVRTQGGRVIDRAVLRGLSVAVVTRATPEGWGVTLHAGSAAAPLVLELTRALDGGTEARARARFWAAIDADSNAADASIDLRMIDQTFLTNVSADHWLHLDGALRFDPRAARTRATLARLEAGDGAATIDAAIDVPDEGDALVESVRADADAAKLLRWLPAGLVPAGAERAQIHVEARAVDLGDPPALAPGGSLVANVDLAGVSLDLTPGPIRIAGATLTARVAPTDAKTIAGSASLKVTGAQIAAGGDGIAVDDLALDLDGKRSADALLGGHAFLRVGRVAIAGSGGPPVVAKAGDVDLRVDGLRVPASSSTLATARGDVSLGIDVDSFAAPLSGIRVAARGLVLHVRGDLRGAAPYAADFGASARELQLVGTRGRELVDAPFHLDGAVHDVVPDADRPQASRGAGRATLALGDVEASIEAAKAPDALQFALRAAAKSLRALRPILPPDLAVAAPWDGMGVTVRSSGRVDRLGDVLPRIDESTTIDVAQPGLLGVTARSLELDVKSHGTALEHQADVDLHAPGLALGGSAPTDEHATLSALVDRIHPSFKIALASQGHLTAKLSAAASFDGARRAVIYDVDGRLVDLGPMAPILAKVPGLEGFDLSQLDVGVSSHGALLGLVTGVGRDGTIDLAPRPSSSIAVDGRTDLRVSHFKWARADTAIALPSLAWHADTHASGTQRTMDGHLEVGTVHFDLGSRDVDLNGIRDDTHVVVTGDLVDPQLEVAQHLAVGGVTQDVVPEYPLGDVTFALSAERGPEGVVHVSELKLANGAGGTALSLSGNVVLGHGHRSLSVTTSATQDLSRLTAIPGLFRGRGNLAVEAAVTSPNFTRYDVRASVKGDDVSATLPRAGIAVEAAKGEVPVTITLEKTAQGIEILRSSSRSPYSMLRFADQHPLLTRSGYLSIANLKTPFVSIAPLVGNLEIEQNVISLRQFEMGVRGGTITGQLGLDWNGEKSTVELHVRAKGVRSSHGEPFDGNIAVTISAGDRTIEGRAEVLRIGERHLLDLLDLEDPLRVDPAMNRLRTALAFGYPDTMRIVFDHGFASAHVELGGLARLVSLDDLRGIPIGPLVDKMVASVLEGGKAKEPL